MSTTKFVFDLVIGEVKKTSFESFVNAQKKYLHNRLDVRCRVFMM